MSSPDPALPTRQQIEVSIRDRIDDYLTTVQGIIAFAHEARWNPEREALEPDAVFGIGCRLRTSAGNWSSCICCEALTIKSAKLPLKTLISRCRS